MAIIGHSTDLSLFDLLQANILGRNACRIALAGPSCNGVIYVADGTVTHASFEDLEGREAFFALVAGGEYAFHVETGFQAPRRTINERWENLALEAVQLQDERRLPAARPARRGNGGLALVGDGRGINELSRPSESEKSKERTDPAGRRRLWIAVAGATLVIVAGTGSFFAFGLGGSRAENSNQETSMAAAGHEPLEVTELVGPGDRRPELLAGTAPPSPESDRAVRPTIVCRILIDADGRVVEARVYRSRLDLDRFEEAALDAVRSYVFEPGQKAGRPVSVWINWPVEFN